MFRFHSVPLLSLAITFGFVLGCGSSSSAPKNVKVAGHVTIDGKNLPSGEILLGLPGQAPSVLAVVDGLFSGEAKVGKNHVEIRAFKDGPPASTDPKTPTKINYIPTKYNDQSILSAEVAEGTTNEFKFEVTSK